MKQLNEIITYWDYEIDNAKKIAKNGIDENSVVIKVGDLICINDEDIFHLAIGEADEPWSIIISDNKGLVCVDSELHKKWKAKGYSIVNMDECVVRKISAQADFNLLDYIDYEVVVNAFKYHSFISKDIHNRYLNIDNIEKIFIEQLSNLIHYEVPITRELAICISEQIINYWNKEGTHPIGTHLHLLSKINNIDIYCGDLFFIDNEYRIIIGDDNYSHYFTTDLDIGYSPNKFIDPEVSNYIEIEKYQLIHKPIQYDKSWLISHRQYINIINNYINKIDTIWEDELKKLLPYCDDMSKDLYLHIAYQILDGFNKNINANDIAYTTDGKMVIINQLFGIQYDNDNINIINTNDNICTDLQGTYLFPVLKNKLQNGDIVCINGLYAFYYNNKYVLMNNKKELQEIELDNKHIFIKKALNLMDVANGKVNVDFIINNEDINSDIIQTIIKLSMQNKIYYK